MAWWGRELLLVILLILLVNTISNSKLLVVVVVNKEFYPLNQSSNSFCIFCHINESVFDSYCLVDIPSN